MAAFNLTHIGELDLDHLSERYDGQLKLGGAMIALDHRAPIQIVFGIRGSTSASRR